MFNPPATSLESLNAPRQYGGYRFTDGFAIEGTQTQFGSSASACGAAFPRWGRRFLPAPLGVVRVDTPPRPTRAAPSAPPPPPQPPRRRANPPQPPQISP